MQYLALSIFVLSTASATTETIELSTETSLSPTVRRWKRHCGNQGCAPMVCQECPQCCSSSMPYNPVFNINFNCCGAPRPSPACCPALPPPPPPPPAPAAPCCAPYQPPPCCPPPPPPVQSPVQCCKAAPVPENPCCQVIAQPPPLAPASPVCCSNAPTPANPCCQPVQPPPCMCASPRPVPCRCGANPPMPMDCPNCDMPPPRCSMYGPSGCSMRRMRRDVHEQILKTFHAIF